MFLSIFSFSPQHSVFWVCYPCFLPESFHHFQWFLSHHVILERYWNGWNNGFILPFEFYLNLVQYLVVLSSSLFSLLKVPILLLVGPVVFTLHCIDFQLLISILSFTWLWSRLWGWSLSTSMSFSKTLLSLDITH